MIKRLRNYLRGTLGIGSRLTFCRDMKAYARYDIGEWTYGDPKVVDAGHGSSLKIGRYCSIGGNVTIILGANHRTDWVTAYPLPAAFKGIEGIEGYVSDSRNSVVIGNDVWIGEGAMILGGVSVGDGAVIGAGAVVSRDVAPYSVVVGNPARETRKRFSEEQIKALLQIAWWNWDDDKVRQAACGLCSKDIDSFISRYGG